MARTQTVRDANGKVATTPSGKPVVHGRASSYNNQGCRCDECKAAWATYMYPRLKEHRRKKREAAKNGTKTGVQIKL